MTAKKLKVNTVETGTVQQEQQLDERKVLQAKINNLAQQQRCASDQLEELMNRRDDLTGELVSIKKQIRELRDYQHRLFNRISECQARLQDITGKQ